MSTLENTILENFEMMNSFGLKPKMEHQINCRGINPSAIDAINLFSALAESLSQKTKGT
jgi:hypothetical protein